MSKAPEKHPLYAALTAQGHPGDPGTRDGSIEWNFPKFVIGRDGKLVKRFNAGVKPETPTWSRPWRRPWPAK